MPNYDDLLQQYINDLETGQSLKSVLSSLPGDADESTRKELESLVQLAAAVRSVPHPEPAPDPTLAQRRAVMEAATQPRQAVARAAHELPRAAVQPRTAGQTRPAQQRRPLWGMFSPAAALGMAGAFVMLMVMAAAAAGLWFSGRAMDAVRVENISGQVQIAADADGTTWKNLSNGERLREGQRIRTLGASSASLVFFEGTRTTLAANSDVTLAELNGSYGQRLQVELVQNLGESRHKVIPLKGSKSFFMVRTAAGVASVHGTSFNVRVNQNGASQYAVSTGEVRVSTDLNEVTLLAGQATAANLEGVIEDPSYAFQVTGSLSAVSDDSWTVSGMAFQISETTSINGTFDLGDTVRVTGRILEDGTRVADAIDPASDGDLTASITGILESMEGETWMISGSAVTVNAETTLDEGLAAGDAVRVTFNLLGDGSWLALSVEKLVEDPQEPTATPTATADPNAMPSYEFIPDELSADSCGGEGRPSEYTVTGWLRNTAQDAKDYAANVQLGYLIDPGGEYVSTVDLVPTGWTRLDAGQTATFSVRVVMNSAWATAPDSAEVKLRVFVASATNRPDHLNGRATVTISAGCAATPTPATPSATETVTETPTPEITGTAAEQTPTALTPTVTPTGVTPTAVTPTVEPTETGQCTGADPHPTGMKLAQRYGVPYEEIMYWFCQHYGFGEIDLAYSLALQADIPVEDVFAMRASGMGWGQIKKQLQDSDQPGNGNNGKGNNDYDDDDDDDDDEGNNGKSNGNQNPGKGKDKKKKP